MSQGSANYNITCRCVAMSLVHHIIIVSVVTSVILSSIQHAEAEANVQKSVLKSVFYITECTTFDNN